MQNTAIKTDYTDIHFKETGKLKLLIIVGTRPEIIRLGAVINKCRKYFDCILAHTGQNYDYNLNGVFFHDLKLDAPEVYMDAVGDDLGATIGNIINCSYKLDGPAFARGFVNPWGYQFLPVGHCSQAAPHSDFPHGGRQPLQG